MTTGLGIALTDEIVERVNSAQPSAKPIVVGYVKDGAPKLSLRGSTHVHSPDQLAIWARKSAGLVEAIAENPAISLLYRDNEGRTTYVFVGRARVASDDETRNAVYDASPEFERDHDPDRNGFAVVIDLDSVTGGTVGGTQVAQKREP
ncbi:hypothetical protein BJF78_30665 [Pseudonocardia sp. CNS-139]|nr:hypothetical protein BJF78_30665 [Pseudonocardia sp. CNS-139]